MDNFNISKNGDPTLVDVLRHHATLKPEETVYTFLLDGETEECHLTYKDLDQQACAIGAQLQCMHASGECALLLYPPGLEYIAGFLGCLYGGVTAVPLYPPTPPMQSRILPRIMAIAADARASIVLTTKAILATAEDFLSCAPELKALKWICTETIEPDMAQKWQTPDTGSETIAFLQYTSGSTGTPKGVMLTYKNLLYNLSLIKQSFGLTTRSCGMIWLPPYHDMGLIGGILQPLYTGFPVVLMSPASFIRRPFRWLQAVSRYHATCSGGTDFAYALCSRKVSPELRATLDLSSWDVAFTGAEPIHPDVMEQFATTFEPCGFRREALYPCYGLAEATLMVSGGEKVAVPVIRKFHSSELTDKRVVEVHLEKNGNSPKDVGQLLVGCGKTLSGQCIRIVDPETCLPCPSDQIGEIWLSGPSVAQGYWKQEEETAQVFQAYIADSGEGPFLRTGDLGFLLDGELFITGRLKDLIIIRGRNHYPQDIELTAEKSHSALRPGRGAAFSIDEAGEERLIVVHEVSSRVKTPEHIEQVITNIREAVANQHELQVYAVILIRSASIPMTTSGKIQRYRCREQYLEDTLKVVGKSVADASSEGVSTPHKSLDMKTFEQLHDPEARRTFLQAFLEKQICSLVGLPPSKIDPERPLSAFGLDSLKAVELSHFLGTSLGLRLPATDVLQGFSLAEIISRLLAESSEVPGESQISAIPVHTVSATSPLSHGQKGMWFLHQLAPESAAYNIANAVRIKGELDVPALRRVFEKLVARHPSLRTTFPILKGSPVQQIHDHAQIDFQREEAMTWSVASLNERLAEAAYHPFTLEQGPLLRIRLFCRSEHEHVLLLVLHHIVADFWSLAVLVQEIDRLYPVEVAHSPVSLPELSLKYTDYGSWQAKMLEGPEGEHLWAYWQQQLAGELPVLNVPADHPRSAIQGHQGASETFGLSPGLTRHLRSLSSTYNVTLYTFLMAAYQVLLYRYTGQEDLVTGSPVAGRNHPELAGIVGYFVNSVAIRADLSGNPSFETFLTRVNQTVLKAFAHQEQPFNVLVERLNPDRDPIQTPIFQTMFIFQQTPGIVKKELAAFALGKTGVRMECGGLAMESMSIEQRTAQFDLTLVMADTPDGIEGTFQFNRDLFKIETIDRLIKHFQILLEGIVRQPGQKISEIHLLTKAERQRVIVDWNDTVLEYPQEMYLHQVFEGQAEQTPNAVAVRFSDDPAISSQLTYRELNCRANQLVHYLQTLHNEEEPRIGIYIERSPDMLVGLLGVLKSGATYVPLDPTFPRDRIAFMVEDARISVVLTQERLVESLPGCDNRKIVCLDRDWETIARQPDINISGVVNSENLAYIIYTSGSTGKPKGVQIPHRAVVNFLYSMQQQFRLTESDVFLAVTTLSFDISVLELFLPLITGGQIALSSRETATDGVLLSAYLERSGATIMQATPSTWRMLLEAKWTGKQELTILCGGEAFPRELANRLIEKGAAVWNMYGPTETTIWSTMHQVTTGEGAVSIGRPIGNTQVYILDTCLKPMPVGVPGKFYIGGDGLARGYFRRPVLTSEKFIPDPFNPHPGARLYDTGDLARYLPDGNIEFLGRIDHQVKLRGFRIELGEIETRLRRYPAVQDTVVLVREDVPGDKRLVAYVVSAREQPPAVSELRRFLKETLPGYMVPTAFVFLDAFPLTLNGKINRRELPVPGGLRPELETAYQTPQNELERIIAQIWQEALKVDKVGIYDNFFDLGGHSLLMAQVHRRLRETLESNISMVELFQYTTVHSLAKHLSDIQNGDELQTSYERVDIRSSRKVSMKRQRQRRRKNRGKINGT